MKREAAEIMVVDGPDDKGNMYERPGKISDKFPVRDKMLCSRFRLEFSISEHHVRTRSEIWKEQLGKLQC